MSAWPDLAQPNPYHAAAGRQSRQLARSLSMTKGAAKPRARATWFRGGAAQPSSAAGGARLAETLTQYPVPARGYEPAVPSLSISNIMMMSLRFSQHSRT